MCLQQLKAFVLVIAIFNHGDHMVGILPREWRWCILSITFDQDIEMNHEWKDLPQALLMNVVAIPVFPHRPVRPIL